MILYIISLLILFTVCKHNPIPKPEAVVTSGNARFTVLTPNLIRLEYSKKSPPLFHDEPSLSVLNRYLDVPSFSQKTETGILIIETSDLLLNYNVGKEFSGSTLSVNLKIAPKTLWTYGSPLNGSLHGTIRTLDGIGGEADLVCHGLSWDKDNHCEEGLISRGGWAIIDDSQVVRMDSDEWQYPTKALDDGDQYTDIYFFGHGYNYKKALYDFSLISGKTPVPPRYALGTHYSRYYGYTDQEELDLVLFNFEQSNLPLDVLVIDIDWHRTFPRGIDPNPHHIDIVGWTGFSWDRKMFNNPTTFLKYINDRGLYITLNLHPDSGIQFFEDMYVEMATAVGIDPSTDQTVPFNITDKSFAKKFYDIVITPYDKQGIKFWWIDWQQGEKTHTPHLNPTFLTNHLWFTYPTRWVNNERPWILGRWGGYGNHRYPVGFSGDAVPSWATLKFQIYFTYTAANVLYQWGNDLGGHTAAIEEGLYVRWLQFGLLTASFRPHCTKGYTIHRDPWRYHFRSYEITKRIYTLRENFVPYLEKYFINSYNSGLQPIHGLYYEHPEDNNVYNYQYQYFFGDDMIASPIYEDTNDKLINITYKETYLPQGDSWMGYFSGRIYTTNIVKENYLLSEIPLFVRVGSVIPLNTVNKVLGNAEAQSNTIILSAFLGDITQDKTFTNYIIDTDGKTYGFENGEYVKTLIKTTITNGGNNVVFDVKFDEGKSYPGLLQKRNIILKVKTVYPPRLVYVNSKNIVYSPFAAPNEHMEGFNFKEISYSYTINDLSLYIYISDVGIFDTTNIQIMFDKRIDTNINNGLIRIINRAKLCKDLLDVFFWKIYVEDYPTLLKLSGLGTLFLGQATYQNIVQIMSLVNQYRTEALNEINNLSHQDVQQAKNSCITLLNDV